MTREQSAKRPWYSSSRRPVISARSWPAQKAVPFAASTTTRTAASIATRVMACSSSERRRRDRALRFSGRLSVQCAWRALLVWVPVAGLLLLSYWLEAWYWSLWGTAAAPVWALWLSTVIWWATWLLLGAYIILALRYPTRSLHDRLAGTYLVPR